MLSKVISYLPAHWIRSIGRLQFQLPVIGPVIGYIGRNVLATRGVIRHGIGSGLRFDATGGVPGFLFGTSEPAEQEALARYLRPGSVFYDVGANIGFFAILAARLVGPTGRVVAFEPSPTNAEALRRNVGLNGFMHVDVIEAAAGAEPGEATLQLGVISGTNSIKFHRTAGTVTVPLVTLDEIRRQRGLPAPTLVMLDCEGAEIDVLRGMAATIREVRPVIMVEVHWLGRSFLDYCRDQIEPLDYTVRPLTGPSIPEGPVRWHAVLEPNPRAFEGDTALEAG